MDINHSILSPYKVWGNFFRKKALHGGKNFFGKIYGGMFHLGTNKRGLFHLKSFFRSQDI